MYKENPSVILKRFNEWVGRSYFNITTQKNRAVFILPASTVLNAYEEKRGKNPGVYYNCARKRFSLDFGAAMAARIQGDRGAYLVIRIDEKQQFAYPLWKIEGESDKLEGIDEVNGEIKGTPKNLPSTVPASATDTDDLGDLEKIDSKNPLSKIMTAKTLEISATSKGEKNGYPIGIYARWNFSKTLRELKNSGDLVSCPASSSRSL